MRILLVEDEPEASRLTAALIATAGFDVDEARSLHMARNALDEGSYALLIIDRRLPDGDGLSLLPFVRDLRPGVQVMMLTAMDALDEKVLGLEEGADDYVTKPFLGEELIARIRACLRRSGFGVASPICVGALRFDPATREVCIAGEAIPLHQRELKLLEALVQRANRVVQRDTLIGEVFSSRAEISDNALDTAVSRLRRRLAPFGAGISIHTLRGVGYMLTESFD